MKMMSLMSSTGIEKKTAKRSGDGKIDGVREFQTQEKRRKEDKEKLAMASRTVETKKDIRWKQKTQK